MQLMQADATDLVVINAEKVEEAQALVDRIATLEPQRRPKVVAVLTDRGEDLHSDLRRGGDASSPRVRVFVKPLHMHGLLDIVKRLERTTVE